VFTAGVKLKNAEQKASLPLGVFSMLFTTGRDTYLAKEFPESGVGVVGGARKTFCRLQH
jgi:hypothetical protein